MFGIYNQVQDLLRELGRLNIRIFLGADGIAHLQPADRLTSDLKPRLRELKAEILEHLQTVAEEVIDVEEQAHKINTARAPTLCQAARLEANIKAAPRYQAGAVLVNSVEGARFAGYVRQLVRLREQREKAERGEIPPAGRYATDFDVFKD